MFACVRSPVCLACAWILEQAWRVSVGTDADVKEVSWLRYVYMNWWLTPPPPINLRKYIPMYPSVQQLGI